MNVLEKSSFSVSGFKEAYFVRLFFYFEMLLRGGTGSPEVSGGFNFESPPDIIYFCLPAAFIFALKQRRSRKFKAAFSHSPAFSYNLNSDG